MKVTDMNGLEIIVTNLDQAMAQAERFTAYRHRDSSYRISDQRQQAYWKHILEQLKILKQKS